MYRSLHRSVLHAYTAVQAAAFGFNSATSQRRLLFALRAVHAACLHVPACMSVCTARAAWHGGVFACRFERKKSIGLALEALQHLLCSSSGNSSSAAGAAQGEPRPRLVVAGGYDVRVAENVEHLKVGCQGV